MAQTETPSKSLETFIFIFRSSISLQMHFYILPHLIMVYILVQSGYIIYNQ